MSPNELAAGSWKAPQADRRRPVSCSALLGGSQRELEADLRTAIGDRREAHLMEQAVSAVIRGGGEGRDVSEC